MSDPSVAPNSALILLLSEYTSEGVDVRDLTVVTEAFGSTMSDERWNSIASMDKNRKTGIFEMKVVTEFTKQ